MSWFKWGKKDAADDILEKLRNILIDDDAQTRLLPDEAQALINQGVSVDSLDGASGEFGRVASNPIPVNGPIGEISYISRLRTISGQRVLGHRIATYNKLDIYETLSFDGSFWDMLIFDMYHPRKSKLSPSGYRLLAGREVKTSFSASNDFVDPFPAAIRESFRELSTGYGPLFMGASEIKEEIPNILKFERPHNHLEKVGPVIATYRRLLEMGLGNLMNNL